MYAGDLVSIPAVTAVHFRNVPLKVLTNWSNKSLRRFQFFRTSEPTAPSWDCPDGQLAKKAPFAFTGAPRHKQAIWYAA